MKKIRFTLKKICLRLFWPVYRQLQHEMHLEFNRLSQGQADFHDQLVQQVSDQLMKLHHIVEELQNDRTNQKLESVVAELANIRDSIDRLKIGQHGR